MSGAAYREYAVLRFAETLNAEAAYRSISVGATVMALWLLTLVIAGG